MEYFDSIQTSRQSPRFCSAPTSDSYERQRSHRFECGIVKRQLVNVTIVAIENQCTPDRTRAARSVCQSFQLGRWLVDGLGKDGREAASEGLRRLYRQRPQRATGPGEPSRRDSAGRVTPAQDRALVVTRLVFTDIFFQRKCYSTGPTNILNIQGDIVYEREFRSRIPVQ